ncbi:hypothetical protein Pst134EA_013540 [Puccinia striiformis f. sp. tritici]|nr:hypothetical protein Pst134EA_013540 [Puccinia striiformis f. sp. tritici]KAH9465657.1 hypothetical protein Pst134EA_013540 [Puccinia striiformis f. sp. tritici]
MYNHHHQLQANPFHAPRYQQQQQQPAYHPQFQQHHHPFQFQHQQLPPPPPPPPQHFHHHQQQQNQNPFNRLQPNPLLFRQQPNQLFNQIQPRPPPPTFHPNLVQPLPPKFRLPPQNQPRTLPNPIQVSLTQSNLLSLPQRTPIGQTPPPSQQQQPSPQKKKIKVRVPLEHTPNTQLAQDESRTRSRTQRVPLKLSINQLNSACPYNQPEQRSLDSFTSRLEYSDKPLDNSLPDSIDVYLPGREVWDEFRIEILSDKLSELGYPTHIAPNSTTHSNIGEDEDDDEEEQDLRQRLDLRERLQAFLQENPEATFHIPSITGVFPFPTLTQPVLLPISSPSSPPGSPLLKPATPVETPENQPTSSSSTIVSATAAPFISHPQTSLLLNQSASALPALPSLKPTAAEFKPSLATHPFSSIWGPPLPASELPPTPSLFQPAGSLNPYPMSTPSTPLDVVGEEDENDIITDSDPDEQEGQLNSDLDQLDNEHSALGDRPLSAQEEDDDIPLARLQHSLQRHIIDPTHEALPRCYVSAADTDPGESAYDGDSDRQSDCTNPSDEDEVDHQNPEIRLSSSRKSMSAGEGYPHNWINGYEEEEDDMVSNPSDEEEAQLHQSQSAVNNTSSSEITSPAKQSPTASTFKNSTPTSRFLLKPGMSPDQATNLAITVGRATGNVMSTGLSPIKKPLSTTSLNAFAVEFKPSFASATPLLRYPSITFSDNLETPGPNKLQFTSTLVKTQAATQAEVTKTSNETEDTPGSAVFASSAPDGMSSIIFFEHPVSPAPFSSPSIPALKELESAPPSPCAPKSTDELSEQPGKDNMRDFKFPATPTSRMIFYQTQMSRSTSSSAIVSPILALDQAVDFKHPSDALPLGNAPQLASSDSVPMIASGSSSLHPQILYPSPVFDSPANEKPSVSGTAPSIVLRQRSSFDDDSGSENSQSAPRHLSDGKVGSPDFYRLIPTQPRSKSPGRREASSEQDGEADEDDYDFDVGEGEDEVELRSHKSHNSLVSLRQLQEQKRQWERLSSTGLNRDGNCNRSDYDDDRNSSGSNRHNPSTESIRVLLEVDTTARKRHSKPPQVNVPPGSPFSPFEGSFDEDPPTLRLRPLTPHAILPPSLPRLLAFKPSKENLTKSFKSNASSPQGSSRHQQEEELEGVPDISIRNRSLNISASPRSPATRWFAKLHDAESSAQLKPETSTVEDETLCSSKKLDEDEDEDRDSSSGDSSSNSSFIVEADSRQYPEGTEGEEMKSSHAGNQHRQLFMSDLERLLTRKLKGLRKDLGELHSLKVDWDSLKRDAILDEINVRMDNILNSWLGGSGREKIAGSILSEEKADLLVAAIDRWGSKTEEKLVSVIRNMPSSANLTDEQTPRVHPEFNERLESALELLHSKLATPSLGLDLDELTSKLSEAVNPQIAQLINISSDKSETADLIFEQLKPCFSQLNNELGTMIQSFSAEMAASQSGKLTHNDSQQKLLDHPENQSMKDGLQELKIRTNETLETVQEIEAKSTKNYDELSNQIDRVGQELSEDLKKEIEKMIDRRQETEQLIDQLRSKNAELESNVVKARAEHGKIRSERAVERERQLESHRNLSSERDRLVDSTQALRDQLDSLAKEKIGVEAQKSDLIRNLDQSNLLTNQLNVNLEDYKTREIQWEREKTEQKEKITKLEIQTRTDETELITIKNELKMKEIFYETYSISNEKEIQTLKDKEIQASNQIQTLIQEKIPLIKNFDAEIRDLIKGKSEADGEIRTLKKRINDQDEQIGNLHQSSASKQQALAIANQKLSEFERRSKQDNETVKTELEKIKSELKRVKNESEMKSSSMEEEKRVLQDEISRMRNEAIQIKEEVESVYQNISVELKESLSRQNQLESELNSSKDVNQLLKNQLSDLRAYYSKHEPMMSNHYPMRRNVGQNGLMVIQNDDQPHWGSPNSSHSTGKRYLPPSGSSPKEGSSDHVNRTRPNSSNLNIESIDFVNSTIPLNQSIHAPQPTTSAHHPSSSLFNSNHSSTGFDEKRSDLDRCNSRLSTGTITHSHSHSYHQHQHQQLAHLVDSHRNLMNHSPAPSRASVVSRITMDQDGWWAASPADS